MCSSLSPRPGRRRPGRARMLELAARLEGDGAADLRSRAISVPCSSTRPQPRRPSPRAMRGWLVAGRAPVGQDGNLLVLDADVQGIGRLGPA